MPTRSRIDMTEATRLTREGRLQEAMALLQGGTRPGLVAAPPADRPAGAGSWPPVLDMAPPPRSTGGAWSVPTAAEAPPPEPGSAGPMGRFPPALQGLVDRMGALGQGLGGPAAGARAVAPAMAAGARFEEHVHSSEAGSRPYKLYIPSIFAGEPLPLVVMLHGCTQSPDDFAAGTRMNEPAEELGLLVAYPGQTQAANMSRCWNWFSPADQSRGRGESALIAGITREVSGRVPVCEGQVFVAGLSAGGAQAAVMGAAYPDLYAAVGVHSGLACGAARDMGSAFVAMKGGGGVAVASGTAVRTIVFHGDRDGTVHPVNGDEVAAQAGAGAVLRAEVTEGRSAGGMGFRRTVHRDSDGQAGLEQWVLHGAGHAWSGGSAAGSYTKPRGPEASREMLRFFLDG